jgi:cell division protein FtsW
MLKKSPDMVIVILTYALMALGIVIIFSASSVTSAALPESNHDPFFYLKRQIMWAVLGTVCFIIASRIDLFKLSKLSLLGIFFSTIMLFAVLIPGIGHVALGARRWLGVGPFSFQPAEITKMFFVIYLADYLSRRGDRIVEYMRLLPILGLTAIIVGLIEKEPDLGTSLVIGATLMGMLFMAGARINHLLIVGISGCMVVAIRILDQGYRITRFLSFINPWKDPLGSGYHIIQSLIALGSGGVMGLGLGQSRQKFFYLPEQYTDFVFSILGEELGLIGTVAVVILFCIILHRGFKIAYGASHSYLRLLAAGCTFIIAFQAFMNMGVVIGMLPCTGIPLPFISFGGSSLLTSLTFMGLLVNISQYCPRRTRSKGGALTATGEQTLMAPPEGTLQEAPACVKEPIPC